MVRGFFDWLTKVGVRDDNPAALAASPKVRNRQPKPVPDPEWARYLTRALSGDLLTVGLGYYAGLRKSEITALRCSQVDLAGRAFVGFQRKGGGDDTTPYGAMLDVIEAKLPGVYSAWWERYLTDRVRACPDGFVCPWTFGGVVSPRDQRRYGLLVGQIPPSRFDYLFGKVLPGFTPHQLRHSAATNLLRAGVPLGMVSVLLNHANVQTTMRYCKVAGTDLAEWLTREG
jgi:integrase